MRKILFYLKHIFLGWFVYLPSSIVEAIWDIIKEFVSEIKTYPKDLRDEVEQDIKHRDYLKKMSDKQGGER